MGTPIDGFHSAWARLPLVVRQALEGAEAARAAGGLPCGAAMADASGAVIAVGRNHVYDPPDGSDPLEGTPLGHAEMNVLARVEAASDLSDCVLWSTQQPCQMCAAALEFCGVGEVRYLAADPAFVGVDDPRGSQVQDPTLSDPELTPWAIVANVLFLQPTLVRYGDDHERIHRNRIVEPEVTLLAIEVAKAGLLEAQEGHGIEATMRKLWPRITAASAARLDRLDQLLAGDR